MVENRTTPVKVEKKKTLEDIKLAAKKFTNRKMLFAIFTFIIVFLVCVLSAIPEFVINPASLATAKFWTKTITSLIIGITAMVCFMIISGSYNAISEASKLFNARVKFNSYVEIILSGERDLISYSGFSQWILNVHRPKEQKKKIANVLYLHGITDDDLLNLSFSELENLKKEGTAEHKQISEEQYQCLVDIKNGVYSINFVEVNDFLTEKAREAGLTTDEFLALQEKRKRILYMQRIGSKILFSILISMLLGSIGWSVSEAIGGEGDAVEKTFTIVWDILSKCATAIISAFMGYLDGIKFNDMDAEYLVEKTSVFQQYFNDKEFIPLTEKELAKAEYEAKQANTNA